MEDITIEKTKRTPGIKLEQAGKVTISGRSIPEDPGKFFEPLYLWIYEYCFNPKADTIINIDLEYFNSGTFKCLLFMLKEFVELKNKGKSVVINWYYEEGDDDIKERGEYFESILETKLNIFEKPVNNLS